MKKENKNQCINKRLDFLSTSLFFFATAFIGWCFETLFCLLIDKKLSDRGFLTLPLCPVYGLPITLSFLLLGTPKEGVICRLFEKISVQTKEGERWRFLGCCAVYFLFATAFATVFELIAGILLKSINVTMWDYGALPLNYKGYVCFSISFIWGLLLTIASLTFFAPLFRIITRLNKKIKILLNVFLWGILIGDIVFNFAYLSFRQKHYEWIFDYLRILLL